MKKHQRSKFEFVMGQNMSTSNKTEDNEIIINVN